MEIKEFIENFADQFDETDASVLTPETVFHAVSYTHLTLPTTPYV